MSACARAVSGVGSSRREGAALAGASVEVARLFYVADWSSLPGICPLLLPLSLEKLSFLFTMHDYTDSTNGTRTALFQKRSEMWGRSRAHSPREPRRSRRHGRRQINNTAAPRHSPLLTLLPLKRLISDGRLLPAATIALGLVAPPLVGTARNRSFVYPLGVKFAGQKR